MTASPAVGTEEVAALWLATLQRALGRASHDVKDALNGVSVNVEVVRSRAARDGAPASAVAPFAEAAGQQLERLATLLEAVLSLGRAEREPADVAHVLRRVVTVCAASSSNSDAAVELDETGPAAPADATTRVQGEIVRLLLAASLLDAVVGKGGGGAPPAAVRCTLGGDAQHVMVTIGGGRGARMPARVAEVARVAGVRWTEGPHDLSLAFPRI